MSGDLAAAYRRDFDAVRREDSAGEYWTARDLMSALGYEKWERFEDAIDRARSAMSNSGMDADLHASRLREASGQTTRTNFRLTRYGAYMLAMNGDPRKATVAAAQSYFAVQTRVAETRPALPDITTAAGVLAMAEQFAETARALVASEAKVAELAPKAEVADRFLTASESSRLIAQVAKELDLTERNLRQFLRDEGLLFTRQMPCGHTTYDFYARHASHFEAKEVPVEHGMGRVATHYTVRVKPQGVALITKRLAAYRQALAVGASA